MWVVLLFSAVCITIVAVRLFFALKPARSAPVRKELDDTRTAAASAGQAVSSSATADTLPGAGALQDQKTPREEQAVPANTGGSLSGADARGLTGVEVAAAPAVSTDTNREKSARKGMWVDSHYTAGWCSARIIGFIFGRTFSSGIESPLPKPIPSPLALLSMAPSGSGAMTAAKSISINPRQCSDSNRSFLTLSHRIRYFEIVRAGGANPHCFLREAPFA